MKLFFPGEPDIGCSFEADLCNFTQGEEDDDDWKRVSGSVVVSFTGPDFDHTTRKGRTTDTINENCIICYHFY